MASLGVAVREYPTSTGPVDYALFVGGKPVGVIEAKRDDLGENITVVEGQSGRYANSTFRYITTDYNIRFYTCAYVHTHPNNDAIPADEDFSQEDKRVARLVRKKLYLVTPQKKIALYDPYTGKTTFLGEYAYNKRRLFLYAACN